MLRSSTRWCQYNVRVTMCSGPVEHLGTVGIFAENYLNSQIWSTLAANFLIFWESLLSFDAWCFVWVHDERPWCQYVMVTMCSGPVEHMETVGICPNQFLNSKSTAASGAQFYHPLGKLNCHSMFNASSAWWTVMA
jgi:hypothetical protein